MEFAEAFAIVGKALGAGLCMGIGAIGPALGEGNAVSHALEGMARQHRYPCTGQRPVLYLRLQKLLRIP